MKEFKRPFSQFETHQQVVFLLLQEKLDQTNSTVFSDANQGEGAILSWLDLNVSDSLPSKGKKLVEKGEMLGWKGEMLSQKWENGEFRMNLVIQLNQLKCFQKKEKHTIPEKDQKKSGEILVENIVLPMTVWAFLFL